MKITNNSTTAQCQMNMQLNSFTAAEWLASAAMAASLHVTKKLLRQLEK